MGFKVGVATGVGVTFGYAVGLTLKIFIEEVMRTMTTEEALAKIREVGDDKLEIRLWIAEMNRSRLRRQVRELRTQLGKTGSSSGVASEAFAEMVASMIRDGKKKAQADVRSQRSQRPLIPPREPDA